MRAMESRDPRPQRRRPQLSDDDVEACVRVLRAIEADRVASHAPQPRAAPRAADARRPRRQARAARSRANGQGVPARRARSGEGARPEARRPGAAARAAALARLCAAAARAAGARDAERARGAARRELACYVCKQPFTKVHRYYDSLCEPCGDFNYAKREQTADLVRPLRARHGRAREDRLTRPRSSCCAPARTSSSRRAFPSTRRAATRRSPTSREFRARLQIFGLDLRHTPSVELFTRYLARAAAAARLHREQRVPDRAAAGGLLSPPARGRGGAARCAAGRMARRARGVTTSCAAP